MSDETKDLEKTLYEKAKKAVFGKLAEFNTPREVIQSLADAIKEDEDREAAIGQKPQIYFTRINQAGDLEPDWEKTRYYVEHPEELSAYLKEHRKNSEGFISNKSGTSHLYRITKESVINETIETLTKSKTEEMCKVENLAFYGTEMTEWSPFYWNALAGQLKSISSDPDLLLELYAIFDAVESPTPLNIILDSAKKTRFLLSYCSTKHF